MSKPTLYLHIGSPKTASTSIQISLAMNKEFLKKKGIYTDIVEGRNYSKVLLAVMKKFEFSIENTQPFCADRCFKEDMNVFLEGDYSGMVLTTDVLFKHYPYYDYGRVLEWIKNKYNLFDIKIICYLRRQDFYVESMFNQWTKDYSCQKRRSAMRSAIFYKVISDWAGAEDYNFKRAGKMTPFDYFLINFFPFTRYKDIIKQYADMFGKENIIIRPFEKCQLPNGIIYDFYANVLNFSDKEVSMLKIPNAINQSISRDLIEFITSSGISDSVLFSHVNTTLNYENKGNTYFTHEERKRFLAYHEEGNSALAREYLGREDGKLFYEEIKEYGPYPGLSLEKAVEIKEKLINALELKRGYYYLYSPIRNSNECNSPTTLSEVIESARKTYYRNADEALVRKLISALFDKLKGGDRPVVVYGHFGTLAKWILDKAISYSKSLMIFVADRRLEVEHSRSFPVIEYKHIKELNPSAIIIAAATSGKEIRTALEKLNLEDTVIYPAYDFSDEAWSMFTAPLTTPDGYVNPYLEERCDD